MYTIQIFEQLLQIFFGNSCKESRLALFFFKIFCVATIIFIHCFSFEIILSRRVSFKRLKNLWPFSFNAWYNDIHILTSWRIFKHSSKSNCQLDRCVNNSNGWLFFLPAPLWTNTISYYNFIHVIEIKNNKPEFLNLLSNQFILK